MNAQLSTHHLQLVPPKVRPFPQAVQKRSGGFIWHCPKAGCPVTGDALREGLAVRDIAKHIVASHLPDGNEAA